MMSSNEVISRVTYVKYRAEWKNVYKAQSSEIRATKHVARTDSSQDERSRAQSRAVSLRLKACNMMGELEAVKAKRPLNVLERVAA